MRTWSILIFVTLLLVALPLTSLPQSKPPTPGPSIATQEHQNKTSPKQTLTETNQDATPNPSSSVPQQITAHGNSKETNQTNSTNQKPTTDRRFWFDILLVFFNGLLVISTSLLWWFTLKLWKATKETADAARKSADALPTVERAHLFESIIPSDVSLDNDPAEVTLRLRNEGKTPAIVTHVYAGWAEGTTCPNDMKEARSIPIAEDEVIGGGGKCDTSIFFRWADIGVQSPAQREPDFVFYGSIAYEDIFGESHPIRFCFHHDSQAFQENLYFRRCGNKEANRRK